MIDFNSEGGGTRTHDLTHKGTITNSTLRRKTPLDRGGFARLSTPEAGPKRKPKDNETATSRPPRSGLKSRRSRLERAEPLPRSRTPMKARNAKRGGHKFPKHVNEAYREWIRGLRCVVAGRDGGWLHPLARPCFPRRDGVECAHVKSRGAGGSDVGNCLPLCAGHHREQHTAGIRTFAKRYAVDLAQIAAELGRRWQMDGGAW